jgi:hypothetical protein
VVRQRVTPRNQAERERGGERKPGEEKHLERRHLEPADLLAPMAKPTPDQSHPSSSPRASPEPIRGATVSARAVRSRSPFVLKGLRLRRDTIVPSAEALGYYQHTRLQPGTASLNLPN